MWDHTTSPIIHLGACGALCSSPGSVWPAQTPVYPFSQEATLTAVKIIFGRCYIFLFWWFLATLCLMEKTPAAVVPAIWGWGHISWTEKAGTIFWSYKCVFPESSRVRRVFPEQRFLAEPSAHNGDSAIKLSGPLPCSHSRLHFLITKMLFVEQNFPAIAQGPCLSQRVIRAGLVV